MKIRIPFKMFGKEKGEIELDFPVSAYYIIAKNREEIEEEAAKDAEQAAHYLGVFKDTFQRVILGYERVPGIEHVFQTLIDCDTDEILRKRLLELHKERHVRKGE